ncbi:hypothetical protein ES703_89907 [subsurface metagenome]
MTPYTLEAGKKYAIVCRAPAGDSDNYVGWRADYTDPLYTGGSRAYSNNSGVAWTLSLSYDHMFEVHGEGPV